MCIYNRSIHQCMALLNLTAKSSPQPPSSICLDRRKSQALFTSWPAVLWHHNNNTKFWRTHILPVLYLIMHNARYEIPHAWWLLFGKRHMQKLASMQWGSIYQVHGALVLTNAVIQCSEKGVGHWYRTSIIFWVFITKTLYHVFIWLLPGTPLQ